MALLEVKNLVKTYGDIPTGADRVIFFPRASGG